MNKLIHGLAEESNEILLKALEQSPGQHLFALIDGALLANLPKTSQNQWQPTKGKSLIFGAAGHGVAEVGPILFEVSPNEFNLNLAETFIDRTTGISAGSLIVSPKNLNTLAKELAYYLDIKIDGNLEMVMRFYDPRVLPFWIHLIQEKYKQNLSAIISHWLSWNHDFLFTTHPIIASKTPPKLNAPPINLSDSDANKLVDQCFPFMLVEKFKAENSSALATIKPNQRYSFFRKQIDNASRHGIQSHIEQEFYCNLALDLGEFFDENPDMQSIFAKCKNGEKFLDLLMNSTFQ